MSDSKNKYLEWLKEGPQPRYSAIYFIHGVISAIANSDSEASEKVEDIKLAIDAFNQYETELKKKASHG